jgi:hypothetical protein
VAATAIELGDPEAAGIVGGVLRTASHAGFLHTVVMITPQGLRDQGEAAEFWRIPSAHHPKVMMPAAVPRRRFD